MPRAMLLVTTLLVLAVQCVNSQELGEMYNVTIQQGIPETLKYTIDAKNGTLKVSLGGSILVTITSIDNFVITLSTYCVPSRYDNIHLYYL